MPSKKHNPEEIIGKLREVEIVLAQALLEDIIALAKQYGRYGYGYGLGAVALLLPVAGFRMTGTSATISFGAPVTGLIVEDVPSRSCRNACSYDDPNSSSCDCDQYQARQMKPWGGARCRPRSITSV